MRPTINLDFVADHIMFLYDTKEALWKHGELLKSTGNANGFLRNIRNALKALYGTKVMDIPTVYDQVARRWIYGNDASPTTIRIHKMFGRGFLRVTYDKVNAVIDEASMRFFLESEQYPKQPEQNELRVTDRQRHALFLFLAKKLDDYYGRTALI